MGWLSNIPQEGYVIIGMALQILASSLLRRFKWTATHMLPITRKLVHKAGWKGVFMSLGLSLIPDTLLSPVGVVKGVTRKDTHEEKRELARDKARVRKDPSLLVMEKPRNLQDAMLNSLLKGRVDGYVLQRKDERSGSAVTVTLLLDKEDTPWLT